VPLHFINADIAPGVKISGGNVSHTHNDIEVSCLPQDLPAYIEVDLKDLEAGQSIHASELVFPAGSRRWCTATITSWCRSRPRRAPTAAEGEAAAAKPAMTRCQAAVRHPVPAAACFCRRAIVPSCHHPA
jgi:large subunit ribosomal protein L25